MTGTAQANRELQTLLETDRRYGIDAVMVSQQCHCLHNRIRNQLTEVVTFQHVEDRALKFLLEVGFDEAAVRGLTPGQFIARNLRAPRIQCQLCGNTFS